MGSAALYHLAKRGWQASGFAQLACPLCSHDGDSQPWRTPGHPRCLGWRRSRRWRTIKAPATARPASSGWPTRWAQVADRGGGAEVWGCAARTRTGAASKCGAVRQGSAGQGRPLAALHKVHQEHYTQLLTPTSTPVPTPLAQEHPDYVPLLRQSYALWRQLEQESGMVGGPAAITLLLGAWARPHWAAQCVPSCPLLCASSCC